MSRTKPKPKRPGRARRHGEVHLNVVEIAMKRVQLLSAADVD